MRDVEGQNRVTQRWGAELGEFGTKKIFPPLKNKESAIFKGFTRQVPSAGDGREVIVELKCFRLFIVNISRQGRIMYWLAWSSLA